MGDVPAGWLALLTPVIMGAVGGIGFWFKYLIEQIKNRDAEIMRLTGVLAAMQQKTIDALNLQLEASIKRSNSDSSVARALTEQTRVIESKVTP